jgi:hypothetical protein
MGDMTAGPVIPNAGEPRAGDMSGPGRPDDGFKACVDMPDCIDGYLWSLYERTPKLEAGGAGEDFAWKDAEAAEKAGRSPTKYVIGGMDPFFRVTLYRALRTLDLAGFRPGILCGFRDDYRQSITTGRMKAQNERSFHGGSLRGGYGYGLAADIVSVRGGTPWRGRGSPTGCGVGSTGTNNSLASADPISNATRLMSRLSTVTSMPLTACRQTRTVAPMRGHRAYSRSPRQTIRCV